jgi:hypothetical protein
VHTIWLARNNIRFSSKATTFHSAKVRIHSWVALFGNTSTRTCLPSDSHLLDVFSVTAHCRTLKEIIPVLCKAPSSPWLKVNTDGSIIAGQAACGGLSGTLGALFLAPFVVTLGRHRFTILKFLLSF